MVNAHDKTQPEVAMSITTDNNFLLWFLINRWWNCCFIPTCAKEPIFKCSLIRMEKM
uniref:Uncharacterized protein n=1 Tax=Meloidogyne incognita TaxID=6306 RepID=A0A914M990_MELIC